MENNVVKEKRDYSEFKNLDKRVREIAYRYRYAKAKIQAYEQSVKKDIYMFHEVSEPTKETRRYEKTMFVVENAVHFMDPEHQQIIEKDYLLADEDFWWVTYFSRSTYYRIKRKALIEFLAFFD